MLTSVNETLKEILERIQPKVTDRWPCRRCGAMESVSLLSLQGDLCTACFAEHREAESVERIRQQIGPKYVPCRFETFQETKTTAPIIRALRRYLDDPKGGVFLFGPSGSGKTHLAASMMRVFMQQGRDCQYVTMPEFLMRLKRSFDQSQSSSEEDALLEYSESVLILDDLGIGPVSDWASQILHLLLDKRDRYLKPTILVTNLSLDRLAILFGDPIASRVAGMCQILKLDGEDRRLKGPRQKAD